MLNKILFVLALAAFGYAYYTGWNPLAGTLPGEADQPGAQAGGPAVVREAEQASEALEQAQRASGSGAAGAKAAQQGVRQMVGGGGR